ncbi:MAG: M14 family zinc carboxypeptidase [Bacteroidales bacterium]
MKRIVSGLCFLMMVFSVLAQHPVYRRVKLPYNGETIRQLARAGLHIDFIAPGEYILLEINTRDFNLLQESRIGYSVTIDDLEAFYRDRNLGKDAARITDAFRSDPEYTVPEGFSLGSMGGFSTYDEMLEHLQAMSQQYPDLITSIDSIPGIQSIEGRAIYWWKISDNPGLNEDEPEVLYTALTHAREPGSMQQMLYFMYYLLENYPVDPEVKAIVDETELYFIPCVNPDGYLYNQSVHPDGGGLWRKNRRSNGNGTFGVDLNRNFGYQWGHDDFGSSPNPASNTYRGTAPFSEPETQAVKSFCEGHDFKLALNYHTYGSFLLHPWGYVSYIYAPDYMAFAAYGKQLTGENNYLFGNSGTLLYLVNGDANDWMYGENSGKPSFFSFTPEVGTEEDGFWPPVERIIPQCQESLYQNLMAARLAGCAVEITDHQPVNISRSSGHLRFGISRTGLTDKPVEVSVSMLDDVFSVLDGTFMYNDLELFGMKMDSAQYLLKPGLLPGDSIRYVITVTSGSFSTADTLVKYFGEELTIFFDACTSMQNWQSESWGAAHEYFYSPDSSITHAPGTHYPANATDFIRLLQSVDLTGETAAWAEFYARWDLLGGKDFVSMMISEDGGSNWSCLRGRYTDDRFVPGNPEKPVYWGANISWIHERVDLTPYTGKEVLLGFQFTSDGKTGRSGFYFDDFSIHILDDDPVVQDISLAPGWNAVSGRLVPVLSSMDSIFNNPADPVIIVQDLAGFYQPGNMNSTLADWDWRSGYYIKVPDSISFTLTGYPESAGYIFLSAGWHLLPVLSEMPVGISEIYTDPPDMVEIIREALGNHIFWPEKDVHTLQSLVPGRAYLLKLRQDAVLWFNQ